MSALPNFLYIGTSKAGSTWIYHLLDQHPDVYMASGKGLYYFDAHHARGDTWYRSHFTASSGQSIVGEVSHSYLFSSDACQRIAQLNPKMKLMACLREPADRAFSSYLDHVKNGKFQGTFEEALQQIPALVDRGCYAKHLRPYVERFGRKRLHVGVFDALKSNPPRFAAEMLAFLEVAPMALSSALARKMMPAGVPRSRLLAKGAKQASRLTKWLGLRSLRGRVKTSRIVRSALYRQFTPDNKPVMSSETRERLREHFADEVAATDELLGSSLQQLWGYAPRAVSPV